MGASIGSLALAACWTGGRAALAPRPGVHVVIYLIDTLRRDRLGVYGYEAPTSPHIDALARESFVFDNAYAPAPWTLPSIVSLLSSTFPVDHNVVIRGQKAGAGLALLPERLARLGYRTAGFVTNPLAGSASGLDRGYDHFESRHSGVTIDVASVDRWIAGNAGAPLFLYVHTLEPHQPIAAPARLVSRFGSVPPAERQWINRTIREYRRLKLEAAQEERAPTAGDPSEEQRAILAELSEHAAAIGTLYDAGVAMADANVGALIELLKRRGLWDDTLFVLLSDHGEEFFEHDGLLHGQSLYAELIRAPMIWRFPGGEGGGVRIAYPVTLVDVMPTILEYVGGRERASAFLGRSLLPAMRGREPRSDAHVMVTAVRVAGSRADPFAGKPPGGLSMSLVAGRWKAIWNAEPNTLELYDTEADPGEKRDLASEQPAVAARFQAVAERWLATRPPVEGAAVSDAEPSLDDLDPKTLERLRELGYVN